MNRTVMLALVGLTAAVALVTYLVVTGWDAPAAVDSGLQGVRDMLATTELATDSPEEAVEATSPAHGATTPRRASLSPVTVVEPVTSAAEPPSAAPVPPTPAIAPPAAAVSPPPAPDSSAHFLPGSLSTWATFDIDARQPIVVRAAGVVSSAALAANPDGVGPRVTTATPPAPDPAVDQLVLPDAPFLSLIGRVCSDDRCTSPFLLGANATVCPSDLPVTGRLQVMTNNYIRIGGRQTLSNYSRTTGGYSLYVEAAATGACTDSGATALRRDAAAMAEGRVLRNPDYNLSSGQTFWKPFFVPMGGPFILRAAGLIEGSGRAPSTGPDGAEITEEARWWNPAPGGTAASARTGQLYLEGLPYQALLGRLCGTEACGEPFLVGRERLVCPTDSYTDRVELWINHVIVSPRMLDRQTPLTFEMFELQTRRGGYTFEVAPASAGACGRP